MVITLTVQQEDDLQEWCVEIRIARSKQAAIRPVKGFVAKSAWVDSKEKIGRIQLVQGPVHIQKCAQAGIRIFSGRVTRRRKFHRRVASCHWGAVCQMHGAPHFLVRVRLSATFTVGEVAHQELEAQMSRN